MCWFSSILLFFSSNDVQDSAEDFSHYWLIENVPTGKAKSETWLWFCEKGLKKQPETKPP